MRSAALYICPVLFLGPAYPERGGYQKKEGNVELSWPRRIRKLLKKKKGQKHYRTTAGK
jgi:hypothetical protein